MDLSKFASKAQGLLGKMSEVTQELSEKAEQRAAERKDQIKSVSETLTEKSSQMIQSASELTKSFAETVSDKETYKNMGKTIQTKLTADKDEDGIPDIINNVGKGAVKLGKTISGVQAYQDAKAAKQLKLEADEIKSFIDKENEHRRQESNEILEKFARVRLEALQNTVGKFLLYLDLINKKAKVKEYDFMTSIDITPEQVKELETVNMNASTALRTLSIAGGSAITAVMGIPAIVTQIGAASTGIAISSLHGAAATNAVFAWLGGGSIASGGLGVAGGMAVLGAMTGIIALASASVVATAYFSKKNTEATQYLADVKELKAKMELGWTVLDGVNKRAIELQDLTLQLKDRCMLYLDKMTDIMIGFDPKNEEHVKIFQQTAIVIKSMSELAQVPIMDDDGNVSEISGIAKGKILNVLNNQLQ